MRKLYPDGEYGSVSIEEFDTTGRFLPPSEENECCEYVFCRVQTRGVSLYSEGVYKVLSVIERDSIGNGTQTISKEEVLEQMPDRFRRNKVYPSVSGGYLRVKPVTTEVRSNGKIKLKEHKSVRLTPIEMVKEKVSYNELIAYSEKYFE